MMMLRCAGNLEQLLCGTILVILVKSKIASDLGHLAILVIFSLSHLLAD